MRCFIAIDLPKEVIKQIAFVIDIVKPLSREVRWIPYENIHLTLKFLGDVKELLVTEIEKRISNICRLHKSFSITVKGAGAFPNEKKPYVLWIGVDKSDGLLSLYLDIDSAMSEIGFEKEVRKFSPHLTIGRVKDNKNIPEVIKGLNAFKDKLFGVADVTEVHLMKSVLHPSGAQYSKISSFKLNIG